MARLAEKQHVLSVLHLANLWRKPARLDRLNSSVVKQQPTLGPAQRQPTGM
jgi:hypothetical protein